MNCEKKWVETHENERAETGLKRWRSSGANRRSNRGKRPTGRQARRGLKRRRHTERRNTVRNMRSVAYRNLKRSVVDLGSWIIVAQGAAKNAGDSGSFRLTVEKRFGENGLACTAYKSERPNPCRHGMNAGEFLNGLSTSESPCTPESWLCFWVHGTTQRAVGAQIVPVPRITVRICSDDFVQTIRRGPPRDALLSVRFRRTGIVIHRSWHDERCGWILFGRGSLLLCSGSYMVYDSADAENGICPKR